MLVCGHGNRDSRCGVLGPVLGDEFSDKLQDAGVTVLSNDSSAGQTDGTSPRWKADGASAGLSAKVAMISHIGGHKFAGNVIVYVPPSWAPHPLAGYGVWYGRIRPEMVEGLVRETVMGGRVVRNAFRGAVRKGGEIVLL